MADKKYFLVCFLPNEAFETNKQGFSTLSHLTELMFLRLVLQPWHRSATPAFKDSGFGTLPALSFTITTQDTFDANALTRVPELVEIYNDCLYHLKPVAFELSSEAALATMREKINNNLEFQKTIIAAKKRDTRDDERRGFFHLDLGLPWIEPIADSIKEALGSLLENTERFYIIQPAPSDPIPLVHGQYAAFSEKIQWDKHNRVIKLHNKSDLQTAWNKHLTLRNNSLHYFLSSLQEPKEFLLLERERLSREDSSDKLNQADVILNDIDTFRSGLSIHSNHFVEANTTRFVNHIKSRIKAFAEMHRYSGPMYYLTFCFWRKPTSLDHFIKQFGEHEPTPELRSSNIKYNGN